MSLESEASIQAIPDYFEETVSRVTRKMKHKIAFGNLEDGSSRSIRKIMKILEEKYKENFTGAQLKDITIEVLRRLSAQNPQKWIHTLEVAADQIDDIAKAAKGLTRLSKNSSFAEIAVNVETLVKAVEDSKIVDTIPSSSCCPFFKSRDN